MIIYLIKSIACLLILLLVHRLIFQREAIYKFNRFFLLAAVIGSFLIPLVEIEVPAKAAIAPQQLVQKSDFSVEYQEFPLPEMEGEPAFHAVEIEQRLDWNLILWGTYGLVTLVFLIRFIRNIKLLFDKIHQNLHIQYRGETVILLNEQSLPFSFLSFIFVSKDYFESDQLTDSIFAHEQAHVQGRHSWDNLLIEGLLVVFWFHPGLYLARQAIKLNHEFIADSAALQITPLEQYKTFLLAMMLPDQNPGLVSSLNFSLTKKRFEMMKQRTANSTMWIKILIVLPLVGALIYFFSEKVIPLAEGESSTISMISDSENLNKKETSILLRSDGKIEIEGQILKVSQLAEFINSKKFENSLARITAENKVEMGLVADIQEILRENEIREVVYDREGQQKKESSWQKEFEVYYRNAYIIVEDENMVYTHKTYNQLTEEEKKGLLGPPKPHDKKQPDFSLFESWKDSDTYAIWIDAVVIPNEKLSGYSPKDFAGFFQSGVKPNARSDRFPQPYQVHLYTDSYFNKVYEPDSELVQPQTNTDTITLTKRRVTWMKDISKYPDPTTAYLQKYVWYENLRTSGAIYIHKSAEEKAMLDNLYQELNTQYSKTPDNRKKNLKEPILPNSTIQRNGVVQSQNFSNKINAQTVRNSSEKVKVFTLVSSPNLQSEALKDYLTRFGKFHTKTFENRLFTQFTNQEIAELQTEYHELDKSYLSLSMEERRKVKRANFPYAKIEKDGKVIYKKFEDLTDAERKELAC